VTDGICAVTLDLPHGKVLLDAIATQSKLINVTELESGLAVLEKMAALVDVGGRRN
jgi:hypothetical protein